MRVKLVNEKPLTRRMRRQIRANAIANPTTKANTSKVETANPQPFEKVIETEKMTITITKEQNPSMMETEVSVEPIVEEKIETEIVNTEIIEESIVESGEDGINPEQTIETTIEEEPKPKKKRNSKKSKKTEEEITDKNE
jgi:hypothetical protein